ncbi:hypothetical protein [Gloeobacter kilaueensis]|uniref:Uncharacterized protein n=1 Tax=Gloeobacter kilaueensis (strain ATCC BAA-2537 / CCAP 1431/1 / ULC 316 / JS1) TaxID=1183438 RepID=U5QHK4_GLOK1|nr:hypothetical protein [Gloeobacter kilaueensis]AGY57150.1 hypothetical protein GKIL_0904 [Gloeobacter kilaueensis JS1]
MQLIDSIADWFIDRLLAKARPVIRQELGTATANIATDVQSELARTAKSLSDQWSSQAEALAEKADAIESKLGGAAEKIDAIAKAVTSPPSAPAPFNWGKP